MAQLEGGYPPIERVETGFWSMDRAFSGGKDDLGMPMTIYEVFGFQGIGKTTFATSIAALLASKYNKDILYVPLEHVDSKYGFKIATSQGFDGTLTFLGSWDMVKKFLPHYKRGKDDYITDEMMFDQMLAACFMPKYGVAVLDSISGTMPVAELESSVADAVMGKKGIVLSKLSRGLVHANRFRNDEPIAIILISHKSVPMGGGTPTNTGTSTTGGEMKKNISKIRVGLRKIKDPVAFYEDSTGTPYNDHAYVLEGKVEKNNFGREGKMFYVVGLGGSGLHKGLTAMYECKRAGLCTFGSSITLGGQKFGKIRDAVLKAHAKDDEFFAPFVDALKNPTKYGKATEEDVENELLDDELPE